MLDPTQMKRMAFIGLAIAARDRDGAPSDAVAAASLSAAFGQRRMGEYLAGAMMAMAQARSARALDTAYKEALNTVRWAYWRETGQVASASALASGDKAAADRVAAMAAAMALGEAVDRKRVEAAYLGRCAALDATPVIEPALTPAELEARRLVPAIKLPPPGAPRPDLADPAARAPEFRCRSRVTTPARPDRWPTAPGACSTSAAPSAPSSGPSDSRRSSPTSAPWKRLEPFQSPRGRRTSRDGPGW